jgi:hypothetical protein
MSKGADLNSLVQGGQPCCPCLCVLNLFQHQPDDATSFHYSKVIWWKFKTENNNLFMSQSCFD